MYKVLEKIYNYLVTLRGADSDTLETLSDQIDGVAPASEYDTEMGRITANVALASVVGALTDAAVQDGDATTATLQSLVKGIFDILFDADGLSAWPGEAAPANNVSFAEVIQAVYNDSNELQTDWANAGRLDTILDAIAADVVDTKEGKAQIFPTTIDLHQAAGTYDVATATTQACLIESIVFTVNDDVSDDAALTAVTFQTDTTTEQEFINNVDGAVANLTDEAQIAWEGAVLLRATDKIQFTIEGGTATADPTTCNVIIKYRAVVDGGYLA